MTIKESKFIAKTFVREYCAVYNHFPLMWPLQIGALSEGIRACPWGFERLVDSFIMRVLEIDRANARRFEILQEIRRIASDPRSVTYYCDPESPYNSVSAFVDAQIAYKEGR